MVDKTKNNILFSIDIPRETKVEIGDFTEDKIFSSLKYELVIQRAKNVDKFVLESLYEIYKEHSNANELIVIDEEKFIDFIIKYLPIYLQEINNE